MTAGFMASRNEKPAVTDRRYSGRPSSPLFWIVFFGSCLSVFAQQRPLLTEDPRITAAGTITTEIGLGFFNRARFPLSRLGGNELQVPVNGLHVNLGELAEFQLTGSLHNFLWVRENGSGTRHDFGDIAVSTKIRILDEKHGRPIIGFRPTVILPNSNDQKGIGTNTTQFFASVLFGKHVRRIFLFGNAGLGILDDTIHPRAQQDVLTYGLAVSVPASGRLNLMSEVNGMYNPRKNPTPGSEDRSQVRVGIQVKMGGLRWDAAGTAGLTGGDHRAGLVTGVTKEFRLWK